MKRIKRDKLNISICFTPRRVKVGHSYGYDKPKFYTTYYIEESLNPNWAADDLTEQLLARLKAHGDQIVAMRKGTES